MPVVTFSTRKNDIEANDIVEDIKSICIRNGINFSYICIEALKDYKQTKLDTRDDLR